jgi:hypothetical protein
MLQISRSLGASEYLCGEWAVEHYLRKDEFDRASVAIVAQYWIPPIYPQRGTDLFVADLSILDAMMVMGRGSATYVM